MGKDGAAYASKIAELLRDRDQEIRQDAIDAVTWVMSQDSEARQDRNLNNSNNNNSNNNNNDTNSNNDNDTEKSALARTCIQF